MRNLQFCHAPFPTRVLLHTVHFPKWFPVPNRGLLGLEKTALKMEKRNNFFFFTLRRKKQKPNKLPNA